MSEDTIAPPGDRLLARAAKRRVSQGGAPLRLSPGFGAALERFRARFGIGFEILTPSLSPWLPEAGGDLSRALEQHPQVANELSATLSTGRAREGTVGDASYILQPLRASGRSRRVVGLLAVRRPVTEAAVEPNEESERWADILRTFIDADLEGMDDLRQERLRSRRTWAALRFLGQLTSFETESEVARAMVHAAAVWFDVDARVYRRDLSGNLKLHTYLPGVEPGSVTLAADVLEGRGHAFRVAADTGDLRWASPEALVVPLTADARAEWVLVLGGILPPDAEAVFGTLGQTISTHLERLQVRRQALVRAELERVLIRSGRAPELMMMDALRYLMERTGASVGVISVHAQGRSRRVAAYGGLVDAELATPPDQARLTANEFVHPVSVGSGVTAVFELRCERASAFAEEAGLVFREGVAVVHLWLAGNPRAFLDPFEDAALAVPAVPASSSAEGRQVEGPFDGAQGRPKWIDSPRAEPRGGNDTAFVQRINEELERARRFELELSMLLIDMSAPASANGTRTTSPDVVSQVIQTVRGELRGSDLLGLVGPGLIAVLLVHTDVHGVASVMPRLRRRLAAVLPVVEVSGMRLGRAVMSDDCRTASALLTQASRDVEAVAS